MKKYNKLHKSHIMTFIVWACMVFFTALSICIIFGWGIFSKYTWLRTSLMMSTLTCLWVYALWFECLVRGFNRTLNIPFFIIFAVPFDFILIFPDLYTLSLHLNRYVLILAISQVVIHGIGFYVIQRVISRSINYEKISESWGKLT